MKYPFTREPYEIELQVSNMDSSHQLNNTSGHDPLNLTNEEESMEREGLNISAYQ